MPNSYVTRPTGSAYTAPNDASAVRIASRMLGDEATVWRVSSDGTRGLPVSPSAWRRGVVRLPAP